jgi:MoxR-like ATPase
VRLQQALHPNVIKRLQHMVFVGGYVSKGNAPAASDTQFFIQCLSPVPKTIQEAMGVERPIFSGLYANKHNQKALSSMSEQEAEQFLLVFRLKYWNESLSAEIIRTEKRTAAEEYRIIPIPHLLTGQARETLERKLEKGCVSFFLPKYPSDFTIPELLIYEGRLYGNLSLKSTFSSNMYVEQKQQVRFIDVERLESLIEVNMDDQLYFVSADTYQLLMKQLQERGKNLKALTEQEKTKTSATDEKERLFLQGFKQRIFEKGLFFEEADVYNFHVCVKTNPITIVGGMPGIGKSQLVQAYGEALGLKQGKELLWVPCSPSYQDPQDILGYLHPNGTYMESDTGVVRVLLDAAAHPEQMYMIVFDEMNLSHIEHWFTSFLSLLELDEENRILSLYSASDNTERDIPPVVSVGNNVIFVGTINFDETTKELSDRLLDRVNVISLKKMPFREALHARTIKKAASISVTTAEFRGKWTFHRQPLTVLTEEELELLDVLHETLQSHDLTKGISFRVAAAIALYLDNVPTDENNIPYINREEAIDLQIKQRVLTKIRGMESTIGPLLSEDNRKGKSLFHVFQSPLAKEVSAFVHCASYLKQKAQDLELYGYAK